MAAARRKIEIIDSIDQVAPEAWDALIGASNPFVEHAFLQHLERTECVGRGTGWVPRHVIVRSGSSLLGAMPAYLKDDSYGEYIFDWAWAEAAARAGIEYYPKIVSAVPFTPATGPRMFGDAAELITGLDRIQSGEGAAGTHVLFCLDREATELESHGFVRRATHQYHWRNDGYRSFDDFLAALRSEARKQIKKERRRVLEAGVEIVLKEGSAIDDDDWRVLDRMYRVTSGRKWGRPYLTKSFFLNARSAIGSRALAVFARREGEIIAATLSFVKGDHVYGRYWGSIALVDGLHFELCYYQLIEYAIRTGKTLVEAGAQGEHKLKRGFVPVAVHSAHRLSDRRLFDSITRFLKRERAEVMAALPEWAKHAPFREGAAPKVPPIAGLD